MIITSFGKDTNYLRVIVVRLQWSWYFGKILFSRVFFIKIRRYFGTFYHFKTNTMTSNTTATTTSNTTDTMAFLQYKAGAISGKVTTEETRDRKKKYEKDWERQFIDSWKQDRPWLHHNAEKNVMVCNWCIEASGPKLAQLKITRFVISTWK